MRIIKKAQVPAAMIRRWRFTALEKILFVRHEWNHSQWKTLGQMCELLRRANRMIEQFRPQHLRQIRQPWPL